MANPLFAIATTMLNAVQALDTTAHNVANSTTPGYKKEVRVSRPFGEFLVHEDPTALRASSAAAGLPVSGTVIDHRPGVLKHTANPLDVAIESEGFFELMSAEGPLYTRQGAFRLDARGRLVTESGLPVLGQGGEIVLTTSSPTIDKQGRIFDGGRLVGELRTVRFENPASLQSLGGGLFAASPDSRARSDRVEQVRQGYLEASNVSTTSEMVRLIETMRQFEASQKLLQGYDQMLDTAIRRLGEF